MVVDSFVMVAGAFDIAINFVAVHSHSFTVMVINLVVDTADFVRCFVVLNQICFSIFQSMCLRKEVNKEFS